MYRLFLDIERRKNQANVVENRWKDTSWVRKSFFVVQKVDIEVIGRCYYGNEYCKRCIATLYSISIIPTIRELRPPLTARIVRLGHKPIDCCISQALPPSLFRFRRCHQPKRQYHAIEMGPQYVPLVPPLQQRDSRTCRTSLHEMSFSYPQVTNYSSQQTSFR